MSVIDYINELINIVDSSDYDGLSIVHLNKLIIIHEMMISTVSNLEKEILDVKKKTSFSFNVSIAPIITAFQIFKSIRNNQLTNLNDLVKSIKKKHIDITFDEEIVDEILAFADMNLDQYTIYRLKNSTVKLIKAFFDRVKPKLIKIRNLLINCCNYESNSRELMKRCSKIAVEKKCCGVIKESGYICNEPMLRRGKCKFHIHKMLLDEIDRLHS